jgi:hypothetical protein
MTGKKYRSHVLRERNRNDNLEKIKEFLLFKQVVSESLREIRIEKKIRRIRRKQAKKILAFTIPWM